MDSTIKSAIHQIISNGQDERFMVLDLDDVQRKVVEWKRCLPMVEPYYAVKCNAEEAVLRLLVENGFGFNCGSVKEIEQVLKLGASEKKILYANPIKQKHELVMASSLSFEFSVFDNLDELKKMKDLAPNTKMFIRIRTDDSRSICRLNQKFGADAKEIQSCLKFLAENNMHDNFVGVSFHVGSACEDPNLIIKALHQSKKIFEQADEYNLLQSGDKKILNIGGGYSGKAGVETFERSASLISAEIAALFDNSYRIIAEPGRFFVDSAGTLVTSVIGRRKASEGIDDEGFRYYLDEGVYGCLNNLIYDHAQVVPLPLDEDDSVLNGKKCRSSLWGPTCDGLDCITKKVDLPVLSVGSWLVFQNMGAYTLCAASTFNGFPHVKVFFQGTKESLKI